MEDKVKFRGHNHVVEMTDRANVRVTGVNDVEELNDKEIVAATDQGALLLAGSGLHILKLDLEEGVLEAEGSFEAVEYVREAKPGRKGLFGGFAK